MADYRGGTPDTLDPALYPSPAERRNFYRGYMAQSAVPLGRSDEVLGTELETMDGLVRAWSPASHAMWVMWAIVHARAGLKGEGEPEFDYIRYARCRAGIFRREVQALGIL